jgi:hypothetical protein
MYAAVMHLSFQPELAPAAAIVAQGPPQGGAHGRTTALLLALTWRALR